MKNPRSQGRNSVHSILWIAALLLMFTLHVRAVYGAGYTPADKEAYTRAMINARDVAQKDVFNRLLAIVPGRDKVNSARLHGCEIQWEGHPGLSRVLVVAFMSRKSYEDFYKQNLEQHQEEYILTKSLWVTVVPEMKNYFIGRKCPPSKKRIAQLLGLNPAFDYDVLVEMWVHPEDLFRPSPDPEVTDHESEIACRISRNHWIFPSDLNPFLRLAPSAKFVDHKGAQAVTFRKWFTDRAETIYGMEGDDLAKWGMPWTRLGYSYDWGRLKDPVGLSEFVLRIDPDQNGGELRIKLHRGIDSAASDWDEYFACSKYCFDDSDPLESPGVEWVPDDPGPEMSN